ncbi:MAG: site-2 protease family protein [Candidatus Paceibacterota bacterium]|jgi:regulator of sigma E protease
MSISVILLFLFVLFVLVIVHEFGHFIVAKWVNMRVDEFAFGFPPRLFAKKKGETLYTVNALPLGGYVSIWGENGEPNDLAKNNPRAFGNRPWWAQLLVLVAGVVMNMVLAWIIFVVISYGKVDISTSDKTYGHRVKDVQIVVMEASPESPAYKAGITPGSVILKVTSGGVNANLTSATSLVSFIGAHNNDAFSVTYRRSDGVVEHTVVAAVYGLIPDKKAIGISVDTVGTVETSFVEAFKIGTLRTYDMTVATLEGLQTFVASVFKGSNVFKSLSGPIGIAKAVGQTSEYGYKALLTLVAVLSINLAIFNILPLPALDGGRMVVVIIEAITKRKVPHKYYSTVNVVGFLLLMLLLVLVTIHDITG